MRKQRYVNTVRMLATLAIMLLLGGVASPALAQDMPEGRAVPNGTTLQTGDIAVTEVVSTGTISLFGGELEEPFAVSQDHNAWAPYSSAQVALQNACTQAAARAADQTNFAGFAISVNGQPFDAESCGQNAPAEEDTSNGDSSQQSSQQDNNQSQQETTETVDEDLPRRPAETGELRSPQTVKESDPAGEVLIFEEGAIAVVRVTNNSQGTIDVDVVVFEEQTELVTGPGMVAVHVWYGYEHESHAYRDACAEANARQREATVQTNWNYGYIVSLNGDDVPSSCR